jgi:hypothetical protein
VPTLADRIKEAPIPLEERLAIAPLTVITNWQSKLKK